MSEQRYKMLAEVVDSSEIGYLIENKENSTDRKDRTYRIKGNFIMCNRKNRNGRIYESRVVDPQVDVYRQEMILPRRSIGAAKHPSVAELNWEQAAILTESLTKVGENGDYAGVAKILSTPDGQLLKCLMDDNIQLSVSTRGLGTTDSNGIVNPNFKLLATDCIVFPSSYISEVESIYENFEYYVHGDKITEVALDGFKKDLSKNGTKNLETDLRKFINILKSKI